MSSAMKKAPRTVLEVKDSGHEAERLAAWPPRTGIARMLNYEAPRPAWLVLQNALNNMPYSGGMHSAPMREGMTVDEAFAALTERANAMAEILRGVAKERDADRAELQRYRAVMLAEIEREELLAELRAEINVRKAGQ